MPSPAWDGIKDRKGRRSHIQATQPLAKALTGPKRQAEQRPFLNCGPWSIVFISCLVIQWLSSAFQIKSKLPIVAQWGLLCPDPCLPPLLHLLLFFMCSLCSSPRGKLESSILTVPPKGTLSHTLKPLFVLLCYFLYEECPSFTYHLEIFFLL